MAKKVSSNWMGLSENIIVTPRESNDSGQANSQNDRQASRSVDDAAKLDSRVVQRQAAGA